MLSIFDVAASILENTGYVSTMKLQKLAYYSQAYSLVNDHCPLFEEGFQAWVNGPVCPELFGIHRHRYVIGPEELRGYGDASLLSNHEKALVQHVCSVFSDYDGNELSVLTHKELPWRLAREDCSQADRCSRYISNDSIYSYYSEAASSNPLFR